MSITPKQKLKAIIAKMNASIDALPEDVFSDDLARSQVQEQLSKVNSIVSTPMELVFELYLQPHQSAATMVALKAGWLKLLSEGRFMTADEIAKVAGGEAELIARIMMVLTATGVVDECGLRTYALNDVSRTLLDPGWTNGFRHYFEHCAPVLLNLPDYLARNRYRVAQDVKEGAFADTWGGKNTWALYEAEPARGEVFNSFMTKWKKGASHWFDRYHVENQLADAFDKSEDTVLLVDIGGGWGHVTKDFVHHHGRRNHRLIVQDLQAALGPEKELQALGIETMPYDFFTPQPVQGAKAYYFRGIFHDWPDKACRDILQNTASAMKTGYSKILIDDLVLPDVNVPRRGAMIDLTMMVLETGSERTLRQWTDLLGSVGLRIEKVWYAKTGLESLIEVELVE